MPFLGKNLLDHARLGRYIALPLSVLSIVLCLLPEWLAFFRSEVFVFVNGWDEETYLAWQGVLGAKDLPGYYTSYLNLWLHNLGISGSHQNLIFDTIFLPATTYLVYATLEKIDFGGNRKPAYAVIICLGSVLFNYANPLIAKLLGTYDQYAFLMAGHEYYPSILRTPNPQISFFLLSLTAYFYASTKRFWILLLPIPLLYYFTAIPYLFLLTIFTGSQIVSKRFTVKPCAAIPVAFAASFIVIAAGMFLMFSLNGLYDPQNPIRNSPHVFNASHRPQIPLALLLLTALSLAIHRLDLVVNEADKTKYLACLALASIASVNLQVVTGFMLSQKNYYDYGLGVIFSLGLVILLEQTKSTKVRQLTTFFILSIVFALSYQSQFKYSRYAVANSKKLAPIIDHARSDPLHSVIPELSISSLVAYSTPGLLAPPFSYMYYFRFIERQCEYYPQLLENARAFAESTLSAESPEIKEIHQTIDNIEKGQRAAATMKYSRQKYCTLDNYASANFILLPKR